MIQARRCNFDKGTMPWAKSRVSYRGAYIGRESAFIAGACKSGEWSNRAGVVGGLIGGAPIGGALVAQPAPPPPPVYYAPEPVYVEEPGCRFVRQRYWDGYGW